MNPRPEILIAITGSIGAYKVCEVIQQLKKKGCGVSAVMSACGERFIGKATIQALTGRAVHTDLFDDDDGAILHTALAAKPDLIVVAPATANLIGKYANGLADDLLSCILLATTKQVVIAPAMNVHMWENPAVQRNVAQLKNQGVRFIGPVEGDLACGYSGVGHIAEPEAIVAAIEESLPAPRS